MVLESTMICVDNSEFMRNGDFVPSRMQAEQDAVNLISQFKLRMHPENNVGLLSMAGRVEVHVTLTTDNSRLFMKLHQIRPQGRCNFLAAIRVAHLALKHRQGRNHKTRIVVFIGSPVDLDKVELVKLAKRLKKEKVNVDIVCFGEVDDNKDKLVEFIETLNGREGTSSHLVTVPAGSHMNEALVSSAVLVNEDGTGPGVIAGAGGGFDPFGVDPNEDPELALALRVSMEEQRARQEEEVRRTGQGQAPAAVAAMDTGSSGMADLDALTEDEQIAMALRMSLEQGGTAAAAEEGSEETAVPMDSSQSTLETEKNEFSDLITDPEALRNLVATLPGVDPNSKEIQETLAKYKPKDEKESGGEKGGKKDDGKGKQHPK